VRNEIARSSNTTGMRSQRRVVLACLAATLLAPRLGMAQTYPTKPVRLIVPFAAGGPADIFGRTFAQALAAQLGQPVVVENKSGVGGVAGVDAVAKAPPDGYTLGFAGAAALSTAPFMMTMPFDAQKDLALVTLATRVPEVLVVTSKLGIKNLNELVAYAKARPGKVNFGSAGSGSITHLAGELLKTEAKLDLVHVPYKGTAPAVNDLLGGQIELIIADVPVLLPHIRSGAMVPLAVTSASRAPSVPQVPTTAEAGLPKVLSDNWYGLVAPARIAPDVLKRIHGAAVAALGSPSLVDVFGTQSAVASPSTPEEFASFVAAERTKWGPIIKATGAKME
jgi:tripartite-type tricarboxylate transporter receptor subunit TctC